MASLTCRHPAWVGNGAVLIRHMRTEQRPGMRELDLNHVQTLVRKFQTDLNGCEPFASRNRVPCIANRSQINRILSFNRITPQQFISVDLPILTLPENEIVVCLHGRHRLAAGETFLNTNKPEWGVDFYCAEDLGLQDREYVRCMYQGERPYDHGTIFRNICYYQNREQKEQSDWWWERLSETCKRDLKQFQQKDEFKVFRDALYKLLPYRGLWHSYHIGVFHRTLPMKLFEEFSNYLDFVADVWSEILGDVDPLELDYITVQRLEGRSPFYSSEDQRQIDLFFQSKEVFPSLTDSAIREQIWRRTRNMKTIIPSLQTFQEDTIWLEPCWKILRRLLPPKTKGSLQKALRQFYSAPEQNDILIQTAESSFQVRPGPTSIRFAIAYCQLFLFAQRHFPYMTEVKPRRRKIKCKAKNDDSSPDANVCWNQMAKLALELGFSNTSIQKLRNQSLDSTPLECFNSEGAIPQLTVDFSDDWQIEKRCGRIWECSFQHDRKYMFIDHIYSQGEHRPRRAITSFNVFRHIFHSFFGKFAVQSNSLENSSHTEQSTRVIAPHEPLADENIHETRSLSGNEQLASMNAPLQPLADEDMHDAGSLNGTEQLASVNAPLADEDIHDARASLNAPLQPLADEDMHNISSLNGTEDLMKNNTLMKDCGSTNDPNVIETSVDSPTDTMIKDPLQRVPDAPQIQHFNVRLAQTACLATTTVAPMQDVIQHSPASTLNAEPQAPTAHPALETCSRTEVEDPTSALTTCKPSVVPEDEPNTQVKLPSPRSFETVCEFLDVSPSTPQFLQHHHEEAITPRHKIPTQTSNIPLSFQGEETQPTEIFVISRTDDPVVPEIETTFFPGHENRLIEPLPAAPPIQEEMIPEDDIVATPFPQVEQTLPYKHATTFSPGHENRLIEPLPVAPSIQEEMTPEDDMIAAPFPQVDQNLQYKHATTFFPGHENRLIEPLPAALPIQEEMTSEDDIAAMSLSQVDQTLQYKHITTFFPGSEKIFVEPILDSPSIKEEVMPFISNTASMALPQVEQTIQPKHTITSFPDGEKRFISPTPDPISLLEGVMPLFKFTSNIASPIHTALVASQQAKGAPISNQSNSTPHLSPSSHRSLPPKRVREISCETILPNTSTERILNSLQQLRSDSKTMDTVPFSIVRVYSSQPGKCLWAWYKDQPTQDTLVSEWNIDSCFLTRADLQRRRFNTIDPEQASNLIQQKETIFIHDRGSHFRNGFPPLDESSIHLGIPTVDRGTGKWIFLEQTSSKRPRLKSPQKRLRPDQRRPNQRRPELPQLELLQQHQPLDLDMDHVDQPPDLDMDHVDQPLDLNMNEVDESETDDSTMS